jgi:glucans biosynthesis protein
LDFEYTIHWTPNGVPARYPSSVVTATRTGEDPSYPGTEVFVVDFSGIEGAELPELVAVVEGAARMVDKQVVWNPYSNSWRVLMRMEGLGEGGTAEARCQLLFPDGSNSEVWAYQWTR